MANNFLTPDIIAREALVVLENNLIHPNSRGEPDSP